MFFSGNQNKIASKQILIAGYNFWDLLPVYSFCYKEFNKVQTA